MEAFKRLFAAVLVLVCFVSLCSFELPDERAFITRKVEDVMVKDAAGHALRLLSAANGKPVVLSPVYTRCPMACSLISNGLKNAVEKLGTLGTDFTIVTFSFDTSDTNRDLAGFEKRWKMDGVNWKTVNADSAATAQLLASIDYHFDFDPKSKEYAHPNVVVIITPSGRIARYIYGVEPKARDLKLAIMEAKAEKSSFSGFWETFYVRCFAFDPATKSYKPDWRFLGQTSAGLLMIIIMGIILIRSLYGDKEEKREE